MSTTGSCPDHHHPRALPAELLPSPWCQAGICFKENCFRTFQINHLHLFFLWCLCPRWKKITATFSSSTSHSTVLRIQSMHFAIWKQALIDSGQAVCEDLHVAEGWRVAWSKHQNAFGRTSCIRKPKCFIESWVPSELHQNTSPVC